MPGDLVDPLHDELGDAVAAVHRVVLGGVGVDQHDLQLAAVGGVDQAGRVDETDAVAQCQPAARQHEAGVSGRDGDGDPGRDERPAAAGGEVGVGSRVEVETGVTGMGVGGERQVGVEPDHRHGQRHRPDPTDHPSGVSEGGFPALRHSGDRKHSDGIDRGVPSGAMERPPSVDALARSLAGSGLPHALLVDVAREAIADGAVADAPARAEALRRTLLTPVVNATGVLLHTNLGRAPLAHHQVGTGAVAGARPGCAASAARASAPWAGCWPASAAPRTPSSSTTTPPPCCSRWLPSPPGGPCRSAAGESVEIGGGFRVPEVMAQSGARLVDVGTTNRTRLDDYRSAVEAHDVALVLKVHPSNYRVDGFVEDDVGGRARHARTAGCRRPRQRPRRRDVPVVAGSAPTAVAGRRAGRRADPRRRRRTRHVQRRQAARWPAGRDHRRARRAGRPLRRATRWRGPSAPAASSSPPSKISSSPTSGATS